MNDKSYFKPMLERVHDTGIRFKVIVADAKYSSKKARETAQAYGAEPIIPVRMDSRVRDALKVMKDFVAHGARRLVELFKWRWSVERLFSHGKEWLMLDDLRVRGLEKVFIYVILAFTAKLAVALATVQDEQSGLMRMIKHFTAQKAGLSPRGTG